jgi:acid phosphatase type 7
VKFLYITLIGLLLVGCLTSTPVSDAVLVGAGDIADCSSQGDEATAALLDGISGTVFTTGDNVYPDGSVAEFANCYDPTWGRHKARTYPSPGNHDHHTADAAGYFDYFGSRAGEFGKGYYSYDLGAWHIIVLNSNISVEAGSPQEQWLRTDLAAHPVACTLAYWHHPRFSSGVVHGSNTSMHPLWQALYDYGADVVLAGHEHNYERFAPQDPQGVVDPTRGIRQFVVGSGGRSHYAFGNPIANSEVRNDNTYGVLKLTLHANSYSWEFIPEAGKTFTDSGTAPCVVL